MTGAREIRPGDVIGRWTILEDFLQTEKGAKKWHCRCQCGTERYVLETSLRYGNSKSCGCLRRERVKAVVSHDLTGQQFGELTVLSRLENAKSGAARWLCRCTCGNTCEALATQLTNGKKTRCISNTHEKKYSHCDLTGQRFGQLLAIYSTRRVDARGYVIWHCRCDCGKEADVSYNSLMYGNQKSCGCRKRQHEQKLNSYLTHTAGTSLEMLKSKKLPKDNTTGCKGVYRVRGKYMAKIVFQKKQYFLGSYDDFDDAVRARRAAEELLFDGVAEHYQKWKCLADADPKWGETHPIMVHVQQQNGELKIHLLPALEPALAME